MNETIECILNRRSIRKYLPQAVEEEKVNEILQCGLYAPSAMNKQSWHFTVVTNRAALNKISEQNRKILLASPDENTRIRAQDSTFDNFRGAPVAIIVSQDISDNFSIVNCANAVENMAIAAYALGLGSCYVASFRIAFEKPDGAFLFQELKIPEGYRPVIALCIGYAAEQLGPRAPRKDNTITYIR
jgi:nitroreductase